MMSLRYRPALNDADLTLTELVGVAGKAEPDAIAGITMAVRTALESGRRQDIRRGVSTIGSHRDEMRVMTNGIDVGVYGSRGQVRTVLLALKFAEVDWIREAKGTAPLLLLDETFSELDAGRRMELMRLLDECGQGIVTTTDLKFFSSEFLGSRTIWEVRDGILLKEGMV